MTSEADAALAVLNEAIAVASSSWAGFVEEVPFNPGVPLRDRITAFAIPFEAGLKEAFPALAKAPPGLCLLIVAKGIEASGTHARREIEEALGVSLP